MNFNNLLNDLAKVSFVNHLPFSVPVYLEVALNSS